MRRYTSYLNILPFHGVPESSQPFGYIEYHPSWQLTVTDLVNGLVLRPPMATSIVQNNFPLHLKSLSLPLTALRNLAGTMQRKDGISFRRNRRRQPGHYFKGRNLPLPSESRPACLQWSWDNIV